jgi:Mrp family chromosome partitioning ATPase
MSMRQTTELFKVVPDATEQLETADERRIEQNGLTAEGNALERIGYNHLRPFGRPVRETEITPARLDPHLVTLYDFDPEAAAQYQRLAVTLITGAYKNPPLKRVLLVSAHHSEGRTCVTLNLAASLARARQRVLVVDSDFMRPSVGRMLGVDSEIGLAEALIDGIPPEYAVTRLLPIGFDILPTRAQTENSSQLLASKDFVGMLAALDANYDFILFDSAPLLASSDASLIVLHTHATLLVVRPGITTTAQMGKAIAMLNEDTFYGVVLNRVVS